MSIVSIGQTRNPRAADKAKPWQRHQAMVQQNASSFQIMCFRCGVELPISVVPGQVVLSKGDRLYLGDDFKAVDCV
jgi:hypothetical protein